MIAITTKTNEANVVDVALVPNAQGRCFEKAFNDITTVIEFDPKWANQTGYFDYAVKMVKLNPGEMAKSTDEYNRRLIFVGTRFGTIVLFDRFTKQVNNGVYVTNKPNSVILGTLMSGTSVGIGEMTTIVGSWGLYSSNIGFLIEEIAEELRAK